MHTPKNMKSFLDMLSNSYAVDTQRISKITIENILSNNVYFRSENVVLKKISYRMGS